MLYYCALIFGSIALSAVTGNGTVMTIGFGIAYAAFFYQALVQKNKQALAILWLNLLGLVLCVIITLGGGVLSLIL